VASEGIGDPLLLAEGDANGSVVDIYEAKGFLRGHQGRGSVHHHRLFARTDDAAAGADGGEADPPRMASARPNRRNRNYFRSIYFREPGGGVLFENRDRHFPALRVDEPVETSRSGN